ncbi:MAG: Calx-beta domain-containing protein [Planctomycetaceae bacterium]
MRFTDWLVSCLSRGKKSRRGSRCATSHWQGTRNVPTAESLEPRALPTVFTVTSLADTIANDGQVTLREAIQSANNDSAADTIQFASSLTASGPARITLSGTELAIKSDLNIIGPGADRLAIDGNQASRVFNVSDNNFSTLRMVLISGLTITNGRVSSGAGAGIANQESLTLQQAAVSNNTGSGIDHAIGTLSIRQSTISGNSGSGIYSYSATGVLTIAQSTVSGNSGGTGVEIAGDDESPGTVIITQSTIVANSARFGTGGLSIGDLTNTTITNTIIAGNTLTDGTGRITAHDLQGAGNLSSTSRNNLIGDFIHSGGLTNGVNGNIVGNGSGGVRDVATVLNRNLADNGGSVKTHALVSGSPAINAGSNDLISADRSDRDGDGNTTEADPFDQRGIGFSRVSNGTVDIGAFELPGAALPILTVAGPAAFVAEDGSDLLVFTLMREATSGSLIVNLGLSGSATMGTDYLASATTTVTFAEGASTATVTIDPTADSRGEMDETVVLTLLGGTDYQVGIAMAATGTIRNDDATVSVAATNASRLEANSGLTPFTFTATRTGDTSETASVTYAVTGSGFNPANAEDFGGAFPTGIVRFAVGESTQTITINVSGDSTTERHEEFTVTLSNGVGVGLGTPTATGTIRNNDSSLSLSLADSARAEGDSGQTPLTFKVTRAGTTSGIASVDFKVTPTGSGTFAADATDFGGILPSGTVTFAASETQKTITINVSGDTLGEPSESFVVTLSNAIGATLETGTAIGGILKDDSSLSIAATGASQSEGNSGHRPFSFTVTRTGITRGAAMASYAITGSGANPVDASDFGGTLPSGTVHFADRETSKTIIVRIPGDTTVELDEGFTVTLSNPVGANLATSSAAGTILNDDAGLSIVALDASKREGNRGSTPFTFTVTRTGNTENAVSAKYVVRGSGMNPAATADFGGTRPSGTISFAVGETSKTMTINVSGNKVVESDEDFTVTLLNASVGASLITAAATGTILNDDAAVSIAATDANQLEGNSGETLFTFTVTRSGDLSGTATVTFLISANGIQPVDAADFGGTFPGGILSFAVGEASQTLIVNVTADSVIESDESFAVALSNAVGANLGTALATGLILSEERPS